MKKIAVLSGKGGAGKTFVTVNLAATAPSAVYVDCDVEEPNGHLFLKPQIKTEQPVYTTLPHFDTEKCTGCRQCVDFCRFHALAFLRGKPLLFPEICHACGGCELLCPTNAVREEKREIGVLKEGESRSVSIVTGEMHLGEASGTKIIKEAIKVGTEKAETKNALLCIDCPPGSACTVMESIADADYCIIVAEPTAFGFHNFKMVHELTKVIKKPCGVVMNKAEEPFLPLETYCQEENTPILLKIPYRTEIAKLCAAGKVAVRENEEAKQLFTELLKEVSEVTA